MGMFDRWRRTPLQELEASPDKRIGLDELLEKYDLVEVNDDSDGTYAIVSERGDYMLRAKNSAKPTPKQQKQLESELGTSSYGSGFMSVGRTEYNTELAGKNGLEKYDQMRRSDGVVRGTLRMVKTPVLAARWYIEPASESSVDQNIADFVWKCLTEEMSISFTQILTEALLMCDFGHYLFEKVWAERVIDGHKRLVWSKLAPRHPLDIVEWQYDKNGGPKAVVMQKPEDPQNTSGISGEEITIEMDKLLVFTFDREAGNVEGISLLRSAYKHWYYKEQLYKIDAIQKERHGIGIPVIKLPPSYTAEDKAAANLLGRNLRTNERAHVVLPPFWDLLFAKLEGQPVDALKSIEMHDNAIRENILTDFRSKASGSNEEDQTLFLKATRFVADIVCEAFNLYAIPQLVRYNFDRGGIPKLKARRIGEQQDWRTLSFAIRNLIGAGVIRPDDRLEAFIRDEMDLPKADLKTVRVVQTPQAGQDGAATAPNITPGSDTTSADPSAAGTPTLEPPKTPQADMPRQAAPKAMMPQANAGTDRSGK